MPLQLKILNPHAKVEKKLYGFPFYQELSKCLNVFVIDMMIGHRIGIELFSFVFYLTHIRDYTLFSQ